MLAVDLDDVIKVLTALLGAIAAAGGAAASIYAYRRAQEEHTRRRAERDRVGERVTSEPEVERDDPPDRPHPPTTGRPTPDPRGPNQPWQGAVEVPGAPEVADVAAERPRWYAQRERGDGNSWRRSEPLAPSPETPASVDDATSWWQRHSRPAERAARRNSRRTEAPSG